MTILLLTLPSVLKCKLVLVLLSGKPASN